MAVCQVCGNDYDNAFEVRIGGSSHTFDSFECAIHALAPSCAHCGVKISGHGLEKDGAIYCCAHCAHMKGATDIVDHA
jgi:nitrite reductase/ring-hydroxylating ferredoxin subunit